MSKHAGALALLALAAAAPGSAAAGAAVAPTVRFAMPANGATTGSAVTFRVALRHFVLDPRHVGMKPVANHGHLHFQMDGGRYDFPRYSGANGKLAVKLGIAGRYSPSVTPTITYSHLPRGRHTLRVFLARNDHAPYTNRGATAVVHFTVR